MAHVNALSKNPLPGFCVRGYHGGRLDNGGSVAGRATATRQKDPGNE